MNFLMVDGSSSEDKPLKIPKEVWILVNHLYTKACDQVRTAATFLIQPEENGCAVLHACECPTGGLVPDARPTGRDAEHH